MKRALTMLLAVVAFATCYLRRSKRDPIDVMMVPFGDQPKVPS
jgi:hypothetical protein